MQQKWIVLIDIGTSWPDVFGPIESLEHAHILADQLNEDERVFDAEVQAIFAPEDCLDYFSQLDEVIKP